MAVNTEPCILYEVQQTVTANGNIYLDVSQYTEVDVFAWVTGFTGGTSPTLSVGVNAIDPLNNAFSLTTLSNIGAGAGNSTSIGAGCATNHPIGTTLSIYWTLNGAPTNCTFSLFVVGK